MSFLEKVPALLWAETDITVKLGEHPANDNIDVSLIAFNQ